MNEFSNDKTCDAIASIKIENLKLFSNNVEKYMKRSNQNNY